MFTARHGNVYVTTYHYCINIIFPDIIFSSWQKIEVLQLQPLIFTPNEVFRGSSQLNSAKCDHNLYSGLSIIATILTDDATNPNWTQLRHFSCNIEMT